MSVVPLRKIVRRGQTGGNRYFKTPGLHAGKRLGRILYEHCGPDQVLPIFFAMLPDFIAHWERENGIAWLGMEWFLERIDHHSEHKDKRASHMWGVDWLNGLAIARKTYTMAEFERIATDVKNEAKPPVTYYLYLIPMAPIIGERPVDPMLDLSKWPLVEAESAEYFKFGMTAIPKTRLIEYTAPRSINQSGLYPAPDFYDCQFIGDAEETGSRENHLINLAVQLTGGAFCGREYFKIRLKDAHRAFGAAVMVDLKSLAAKRQKRVSK